jgi:hypothetical protein
MPRSILAAFAVIFMLAVVSASAAQGKPEPSGSFSISPAPHYEGGTVEFTFGKISNVTNSYEVTLGVVCFLPDGTQIRWGNRGNPYIYEFNSFGNVYSYYTVSKDLPVYGTGYDCQASLISARWWKGTVLEVWTLQDWTPFQVEASP